MEGRNKSISYYFTQLNKNDGPCKLNFLKNSDSNQSFMKIKNKKALNKSQPKIKLEQKRRSSSLNSNARICEKMKENSFNLYMNNCRTIKSKKDFNTNASINVSFTKPINSSEEVTLRTLDKIKV